MTDEKTFWVNVDQHFVVTLDTEKFDEKFMKEFKKNFYDFETLEEHAEHIAQLQARGVIDIEQDPTFIEGYADSREMGIELEYVYTEYYAEEKN